MKIDLSISEVLSLQVALISAEGHALEMVELLRDDDYEAAKKMVTEYQKDSDKYNKLLEKLCK